MLFTALGVIATVQIIEKKRNPIYTDLIQLLNVDSLSYHKGGYLTAWGAFEILLGIQKTRMMVNHETLLMRLREATVRLDRIVKAKSKVWWDSDFDLGSLTIRLWSDYSWSWSLMVHQTFLWNAILFVEFTGTSCKKERQRKELGWPSGAGNQGINL